MDSQQISKFLSIIAEQVGKEVADLSRETNLTDDLEIDSVDLMEIVINTETEFDIVFNDEDIFRIKTIGDALDLLEEKMFGGKN